jgi:hypothetical protein
MDDKHPIKIRIKYHRHGFEEGVDDDATQVWYVGDTQLTPSQSRARSFFNISVSMNVLVGQLDNFVASDEDKWEGEWSIAKIEAYIEDLVTTAV